MHKVFRDDECRVRTENAPANFTTIKHMAQNQFKKAPGKESQRLKRKTAGWDDDFLASPRRCLKRSPDSPGEQRNRRAQIRRRSQNILTTGPSDSMDAIRQW